MKPGAFKSLALAGAALSLFCSGAFAAELAKPMTASEHYYAQRNIAQDSDNGALPPSENALTPVPDTADALPSPVRTLAAVPVKSSDGQAIGRVEKVVTATDGHARAVEISVAGKILSLRADQVLYDPGAKVALLEMPRSAVIVMTNGEGLTASIDPKMY